MVKDMSRSCIDTQTCMRLSDHSCKYKELTRNGTATDGYTHAEHTAAGRTR